MLSGVLWVQWRPWSSYIVLGHTSMDKILQLLHCWWLEGVAPWWPGCRVKSSPESLEFYCSRFAPLSTIMWRHHLPFMFLWMEHLQSPWFVPLLHFCLNWWRIHIFFSFWPDSRSNMPTISLSRQWRFVFFLSISNFLDLFTFVRLVRWFTHGLYW